MTAESTDLDTAATPGQPVVVKQSARDGDAVFTIRPDRLDYEITARQGTKASRQIPWALVPSRFHKRDRARPDDRLGRMVRIVAMLMLIGFERNFVHVGALGLTTAAAITLFGLTIWLSRFRRIRHSLIGTRNGNIIVFGDREHDLIVDRIMEGRRNFLRRFAAFDSQQSLRWNLQRLRWLVEQDAVSAEEFATAQRGVLPGLAEPLLRMPPRTQDRCIEQRFCNSLFVFDFKADHLAYRRRTALGNEYAGRYLYRDLAEPNTNVQSGSPSRLTPHVIFWAGLIALGYLAEMYGRFGNDPFAGPDGLVRALVIFGPGIAGFAVAVLVARRMLRIICTKLPTGVMILKDRHHDDIMDELKRRRHEALKAMVEPDPLLAPGEQANLYAGLANLGIIDKAEIPDRMTRAVALQQHLGLSDPKPDASDAISGEKPTPQDRPSSHTIH